jgi:predicted RNase H-like nuclease (RuvC/YqgF family)
MKLKERLKEMSKRTKMELLGLILGSFVLGFVVAAGSSGDVITELENEVATKQETIKEQTQEMIALSNKVEEAEPWFKMQETEKKKLEEEQAKAEEAMRIAEEKKAEEERLAKEKAEKEEQARKEAEEKKGYDTGITYDQLARNPDKYLTEKVKFSGKVVQVMEGDGFTQIRLAVNGDYDHMMFAEFTAEQVTSRVLENDNITIMGMSAGLYTYESTMGGQITIPAVAITKIQQ